MNRLRKKCEKPPFLGILGQNGQFLTFFGHNGKTGIFFKKAFGTFFSRLQALNNCKVSEKSNEQFSSNSVTDGHTYGRTDESPQVSNNFVERPKSKAGLISWKKVFQTRFAHFGQKLAIWLDVCNSLFKGWESLKNLNLGVFGVTTKLLET